MTEETKPEYKDKDKRARGLKEIQTYMVIIHNVFVTERTMQRHIGTLKRTNHNHIISARFEDIDRWVAREF